MSLGVAFKPLFGIFPKSGDPLFRGDLQLPFLQLLPDLAGQGFGSRTIPYLDRFPLAIMGDENLPGLALALHLLPDCDSH